jgi:hypothetical protein
MTPAVVAQLVAVLLTQTPASGTASDSLGAHLTVLGVTPCFDTLRGIQARLGPAEVKDNGGDAAANASAECYVGPDGTKLALSALGETFQGKHISEVQLVAAGTDPDWTQNIDWVVPAGRLPRCSPLKALTKSTGTRGGLKLGMNQQEVVRLLGKPSWESPNRLFFRSEVVYRGHEEISKASGRTSLPVCVGEGRMIQRMVSVELRDGRVVRVRTSQATEF